MSLNYQRIDRRVLDYGLWYVPGYERAPVRGPRRWRERAPYLSFVGAAQTFGRFAADPFPAQVGRWFRMDHLNLGFAGAGPEYFLAHPALMDRIRASKVCFLQVMSGRSVSTPLMRALNNGAILKFTRGPLEGKRMPAATAYRELLEHYDEDTVLEQVTEARRAWTSAYRNLIEAIDVPVVLIWISRRPPRRTVDLSSARKLLGPFPQLVDERCFEAIRPGCAATVEAVFRPERAQRLVNMTTGRAEAVYSKEEFPERSEWSRPYNIYYPSPRMHSFIAREVIDGIYRCPTLRELLAPEPDG